MLGVFDVEIGSGGQGWNPAGVELVHMGAKIP